MVKESERKTDSRRKISPKFVRMSDSAIESVRDILLFWIFRPIGRLIVIDPFNGKTVAHNILVSSQKGGGKWRRDQPIKGLRRPLESRHCYQTKPSTPPYLTHTHTHFLLVCLSSHITSWQISHILTLTFLRYPDTKTHQSQTILAALKPCFKFIIFGST